MPWRRKWQPTPVLLPGEFHGWRSLVGDSPWGQKESDTAERLYFLFIKKNEIMPFIMMWMKLDSVIQNEVSQKEKTVV